MNGHVKIVLPCTNEGEWLRVTVDSILEHTRHPSFEIFILANGDNLTDFSFARRSAYRDRVRLRRVKRCLGVGKSINKAVKPGDAEYYIFLDAHCLLEQGDWLERAVDSLERFPRASMIQPEVVNFTYEEEIRSGESPDLERLGDRSLEYSIRWAWPYEDPHTLSDVQTSPLLSSPYESMAGSGMAVFSRAETFHRLGKHDGEVDGWHPKTRDYCIRAWLLGWPMMVDPSIRVFHRRKLKNRGFELRRLDAIHGVLRTVYKCFSPRRRAIAESLFRKNGFGSEVSEAIRLINQGRWLEERIRILRDRIHDDDWLFSRFMVYEE